MSLIPISAGINLLETSKRFYSAPVLKGHQLRFLLDLLVRGKTKIELDGHYGNASFYFVGDIEKTKELIIQLPDLELHRILLNSWREGIIGHLGGALRSICLQKDNAGEIEIRIKTYDLPNTAKELKEQILKYLNNLN